MIEAAMLWMDKGVELGQNKDNGDGRRRGENGKCPLLIATRPPYAATQEKLEGAY